VTLASQVERAIRIAHLSKARGNEYMTRPNHSQPFIVALMTAVLDVGPTDVVLEVGTGSGCAAIVYWNARSSLVRDSRCLSDSRCDLLSGTGIVPTRACTPRDKAKAEMLSSSTRFWTVSAMPRGNAVVTIP
jgi:hypothetical protein